MTPAAAATPEGQLAAAIAEYVQTTRLTIENVRFLRRVFVPRPLRPCNHEGRYQIGSTGELDQVFPCPDLATVYNFADDAEYCLRHHQKAEASR